MASAIRQMTGVGGDVRKIARLLQKKAPPGHMLAYINQEEADLLKARGGSGEPHADTGVPSFEEEYTEFDTPMPAPSVGPSTELGSSSVAPLDVSSSSPFAAYERATTPDTARYFQENQAAGAAPRVDLGQVSVAAESPAVSFGDYASAPSGSRYIDQTVSDRYLPSATGAPVPSAVATTQDKDLLGQAADWFSGLGEDTKKRLGIASIQGLIGAYQSQQAAEQGRKAKEEMQRMAQPYQQQGKRLIEQAQRGELSAVGQQQLQAVQAQAAQGAQARGGVGAQQAQAQVEAYRQQLLQGQYDYGLKVAGIGDQIMTGAIKTGMQADQYVNQLTSNYYNNIARAMYGQAPQVSGSQPASTSAGQ
jgi:hypothetical protein